ncbi:hypothetical protein CJD36_021375 [Flavipsychrobacter stenotrophus]|uniref:Uncharacterized protein n=1 Tax=Flavipsychrobacter stenotrophus TaxID=2077091 RepID=A0A2S7SPY6_9BACT|nr:AAA family ATPase [Flavipsychrobacter stenotrophus]PQJ08963.1 hypothetical protein CJD36_021375 [Flavipsychrobacter stenotrophus]
MKESMIFNWGGLKYSLLKKEDQYFNHLIGYCFKSAVLKIKNKLTKNKVASKYTASLGDMIKRTASEPKPKMIYSGIKENSIGIIFGPSKSGKTMFCENLGMCIASGETQYLGLPIDIENRKVLFISLEEFYTGRTERNSKQITKLTSAHGTDWLENYIVINERMPRYLISDADWKIVEDTIYEVHPSVVFLDSLTHMYAGQIEESNKAKEVMRKIKELSENTKTTIVVIHHTTKLYDRPLSIDVVAGSRVIAQECDFMIGLNKAMDGKRYIKDVAFRYAATDNDKVKTFTIDNDLWLNISGEADEIKLLSVADGRRDDANKEKLLDFIVGQDERGAKIIPFSLIEDRFADSREMSKPTISSNLKKLIEEKKIIKLEKGQYKLAS